MSTSLVTGTVAGIGMVNVAARPVLTSAPVALASGVIVAWSGRIGRATLPTAAYTPLRKEAAATAVTWKSSVKAAPGSTGFADGVESIWYCSGNLVPLKVLLHATVVVSCSVGTTADAGELPSTLTKAVAKST